MTINSDSYLNHTFLKLSPRSLRYWNYIGPCFFSPPCCEKSAKYQFITESVCSLHNYVLNSSFEPTRGLLKISVLLSLILISQRRGTQG